MSRRRAFNQSRLRKLALVAEAETLVDPKPDQKKCPSGKRIYKKKERARAAAGRASERLGITIRFYRCRSCRWFHKTRKEGENPETGKRDGPKIRRLVPRTERGI